MPQNFVPSFVEVWMQAAQVINQQNALRQRAEAEDERLRLKEQYQNELFDSRAKKLEAEEKKFEAEMALKQTQTAIKEMNAQTYRMGAETGRMRAELTASKAEKSGYAEQQKTQAVELSNLSKTVDLHEKAIENRVVGKPTGNPALDTPQLAPLRGMSTKGLEQEYHSTKSKVTAGDFDAINKVLANSPGMEVGVATDLYLDNIAGLMEWRNAEKNSYLEGVLSTHPDDRAAQLLKGKNFVFDLVVSQPGQGAVQKAQGDQAKANVTGQPPAGASPGTTSNPSGTPPSPEAKEALAVLDTYTHELLSTPEGQTRAASDIATRYKSLKARNDPSALELYQKTLARSPALAKQVEDILRAGRKTK